VANGERTLYGSLYVCHSVAERRNLHLLRGLLHAFAMRDGADSYGMTNVEWQT